MIKNGYSLIEILVVLSVFSLLAILSTQTILLTLRNARKSEASIEVRENLESALSVMERQLRSAKSITACSSTQVSYTDSLGTLSNFTCNSGTNSYISSGSATIRLTSNQINLTSCNIFTCSPATPPYNSVGIIISGRDTNASGVEQTNISVSAKIFLRN